MFVIIKKYKNMMSLLFDEENHDHSTNFQLTNLHMSNLSNKKFECLENIKFKKIILGLFSCNCLDCKIDEEEDSDSDLDEEIELEIQRRKRKKKRKQQHEEDSDDSM
jgi:hypothetical protein